MYPMPWFVFLFGAAMLLPAAAPFTEKEIALGKRMAEEVERERAPSRDAAAQALVARIGGRLADAAGLQGPWAFTVLEGREPFAAALPGGRVYAGAGILTRAESEAELAAVLAHQMGHIAARHGHRERPSTPLSDAGGVGLIFAGGWAGVCPLGHTHALPIAVRNRIPEWEKEADELACTYLRRAGYDPEALAAIFGRLRAATSPRP
jgi:beta-barrel assembly-enhancing protease